MRINTDNQGTWTVSTQTRDVKEFYSNFYLML